MKCVHSLLFCNLKSYHSSLSTTITTFDFYLSGQVFQNDCRLGQLSNSEVLRIIRRGQAACFSLLPNS